MCGDSASACLVLKVNLSIIPRDESFCAPFDVPPENRHPLVLHHLSLINRNSISALTIDLVHRAKFEIVFAIPHTDAFLDAVMHSHTKDIQIKHIPTSHLAVMYFVHICCYIEAFCRHQPCPWWYPHVCQPLLTSLGVWKNPELAGGYANVQCRHTTCVNFVLSLFHINSPLFCFFPPCSHCVEVTL